MADFSHLEALEVSTDKTAEYTLHQISVNGLSPTLIVAPATEVNKPYFNALLKRASKIGRAVRAGNMTTAMIQEKRDKDKELYPKHVVKGWRDVVDRKGKVVKFSVEEVTSFLEQLPDWLFDEVSQFCDNPANFVEVLDITAEAGN